MNQKDKQKNVSDMMKKLLTLAKDVQHDKELEADYAHFLHVFMMSKTNFLILLRIIDDKISSAKLSKDTTAKGLTSKAMGIFWEKVRDIIMETYNMNKEK